MASRVRETIIECLKEAQSPSSSNEDQNLALQTLVTITKVSPQNRNILAQTDGSVTALLALSKLDSAATVQTLALSVLFNLSLNPNLKHSLALMEIISHMNDIILSHGSAAESIKVVASLLCSLAMLDKNKAKFGVAGTIQVLVKAISGPRSPAAHYLLSSLAELVQYHGNCTLAVRSAAVPLLISLVESPDNEDLTGTSLSILGLIARFEEGLNDLKRTDRVVARMVEILKRRCMLSKEGACEILLRLFDASEDCLRNAIKLPEFSSLMADISVRGSGRARERAGLLMEKFMEAC